MRGWLARVREIRARHGTGWADAIMLDRTVRSIVKLSSDLSAADAGPPPPVLTSEQLDALAECDLTTQAGRDEQETILSWHR